MRILAADSDLLAAAGRQRAFVDAVRGLTERGHSVDVFYRDSGPMKAALPEGCRTVQVPGFLELLTKGGLEPLRFGRSLLAGLPGRHDVVLVNRPELCAFAVGIARLKHIPSFCFLRDHRFGYSKRARFLLGRVSHLIAVSHFIRDHYVHDVGMDPDRVHVVYSGVDTSYYRPADARTRASARVRFGLPHDAFVILYGGRIDWTKGVDLLIEAFNTLAARHRNSHLVIAGAPDTADHSHLPTPEGLSYKRKLEAMTPPGRCTWVEHQMDVRPLYHAADVAVVPSRGGEAFGRAVLEPMSAGIPVIGSTDGGIPEALGDPFNGFLFETGDPSALEAKLERILDWRTRDPDLGRRCREYIEANLTLADEIDGLERLMNGVVSASGRVRSTFPVQFPFV